MTTPAGWYSDPQNPDQQQYWDGQQWTEHRSPVLPSAPPSSVKSVTRKPWLWILIATVALGVIAVGGFAIWGVSTTSSRQASTTKSEVVEAFGGLTVEQQLSECAAYAADPDWYAEKSADLAYDFENRPALNREGVLQGIKEATSEICP